MSGDLSLFLKDNVNQNTLSLWNQVDNDIAFKKTAQKIHWIKFMNVKINKKMSYFRHNFFYYIRQSHKIHFLPKSSIYCLKTLSLSLTTFLFF